MQTQLHSSKDVLLRRRLLVNSTGAMFLQGGQQVTKD